MSIIVDKYEIYGRTDLKGCTTIFLGRANDTEEIVAIKARDRFTKHKQMQFEAEVYEKIQGDIGIPCMKWFGTHGDESVLVLEYIGSTLEELYNICSRSFSLKTILLLADQIITRITHIHSRNFLHCNIAPDNFVIDTGEPNSTICLIDYRLAKKYRDERTFEHIPCMQKEYDIGTADFASINAHMGIAQSRRDDLEAVGYMLVYLNLGSLPWQGIEASNNREKCELMVEKKISTTTKSLCDGLPNEFVTYLDYCHQLRFDEVPNYLYLRALFRSLLNNNGFINDNVFDWNVPTTSYNPPKKKDEVKMEEMEIKAQHEKDSTQLNSGEVNLDDHEMMDSDATPVDEDYNTETDSYDESMSETD